MRTAPLWRRLLADCVDRGLVLVSMATAIAVGAASGAVYERVRGEREAPAPEAEAGTFTSWPTGWKRAALSGAGRGLGVSSRNWRNPGFRVLGLRRVDARTGGAVTARGALAGELFVALRGAVSAPSLQAITDRWREERNGLRPQVEEIERAYAADPLERQRAIVALYQGRDMKPFAGCGRHLLGSLITALLLDSVPWRGRSIYDRLTGTAVVVDP
jgi:hypothetical protein